MQETNPGNCWIGLLILLNVAQKIIYKKVLNPWYGSGGSVHACDEDVDDLAFLPALVLERLFLVEHTAEIGDADTGVVRHLDGQLS